MLPFGLLDRRLANHLATYPTLDTQMRIIGSVIVAATLRQNAGLGNLVIRRKLWEFKRPEQPQKSNISKENGVFEIKLTGRKPPYCPENRPIWCGKQVKLH
jgi:hypothetical protein